MERDDLTPCWATGRDSTNSSGLFNSIFNSFFWPSLLPRCDFKKATKLGSASIDKETDRDVTESLKILHMPIAPAIYVSDFSTCPLSLTSCHFSSNRGTPLPYDLLGTLSGSSWLVRGHQRQNWQTSFRVKQQQKFYFPSLQIKIIASFPLTATRMGHLNKTINCGGNSGLWSLPVDHSVASICTLEE